MSQHLKITIHFVWWDIQQKRFESEGINNLWTIFLRVFITAVQFSNQHQVYTYMSNIQLEITSRMGKALQENYLYSQVSQLFTINQQLKYKHLKSFRQLVTF